MSPLNAIPMMLPLYYYSPTTTYYCLMQMSGDYVLEGSFKNIRKGLILPWHTVDYDIDYLYANSQVKQNDGVVA